MSQENNKPTTTIYGDYADNAEQSGTMNEQEKTIEEAADEWFRTQWAIIDPMECFKAGYNKGQHDPAFIAEIVGYVFEYWHPDATIKEITDKIVNQIIKK